MSGLQKDSQIDVNYAREAFVKRAASLHADDIFSPEFEAQAVVLARLEVFPSQVLSSERQSFERFVNNGRPIPPPVPDIDLNTTLEDGLQLPIPKAVRLSRRQVLKLGLGVGGGLAAATVVGGVGYAGLKAAEAISRIPPAKAIPAPLPDLGKPIIGQEAQLFDPTGWITSSDWGKIAGSWPFSYGQRLQDLRLKARTHLIDPEKSKLMFFSPSSQDEQINDLDQLQKSHQWSEYTQHAADLQNAFGYSEPLSKVYEANYPFMKQTWDRLKAGKGQELKDLPRVGLALKTILPDLSFEIEQDKQAYQVTRDTIRDLVAAGEFGWATNMLARSKHLFPDLRYEMTFQPQQLLDMRNHLTDSLEGERRLKLWSSFMSIVVDAKLLSSDSISITPEGLKIL